MSAIVIIRFPVSDVGNAIQRLNDQAEVLVAITESTKSGGLRHHQFVAGVDELVVIDEWDTAQHFQSFFDGNPQVAEVMTSIGMSGPPEVMVYDSIDAPGTV